MKCKKRAGLLPSKETEEKTMKIKCDNCEKAIPLELGRHRLCKTCLRQRIEFKQSTFDRLRTELIGLRADLNSRDVRTYGTTTGTTL